MCLGHVKLWLAEAYVEAGRLEDVVPKLMTQEDVC